MHTLFLYSLWEDMLYFVLEKINLQNESKLSAEMKQNMQTCELLHKSVTPCMYIITFSA